MLKTLTTITLAGVLAITSLAPTRVEANQNPDDLAKLLFGALVIYGIAEASKNKRKREKQAVVVPVPKPKPTPRSAPVIRHPDPVRPQHKRIHRASYLPTTCILTHQQGHGESRTVFGNRCLKNTYARYASLPNECFTRFQTVRGARVGWKPRCLRRAGYTW